MYFLTGILVGMLGYSVVYQCCAKKKKCFWTPFDMELDKRNRKSLHQELAKYFEDNEVF